MNASAGQRRRLAPRMFDTDWLVLRGLQRAISAMLAQVAKPGMVALDFGCGAQPYEPLLTGAGCRYIGADFDEAADLTISPGGRLPAGDRSSDLVLSFQVLEHVRDLGTYFSEARRVLRDGGWLMLSTHGSWLYHPHPEDHRRWTREGLISEISAHGFEVVQCMSVVGPLAWTSVLRLTCVCYALRKLPVGGPVLAGLLSMVMNARALIEDKLTPAWVTRDNACVYLTLCRPA